VDRLAAAGEWERVDNRLRQAGVPAVPAAVWRAALAGGRGAGQLRVTRRLGDDAYVGGEVRWWDAGNLGVWRIVVPIDAGGTDQTLGPGTVIADVGGTAIVSDLSELIGGIEG
jgi:hypothetical protein